MGGSQSLLKLLKNHNEDSLVTLIKQKSININVRDEEDRTALHWAAAEGILLM
jgi:ankyrin repeat protein